MTPAEQSWLDRDQVLLFLCPLSFMKMNSTKGRPALPQDQRELFANLAEKEKIKGHHSPEGRAVRALSRAITGWRVGDLSGEDAFVLGLQAMEDWIKARLGVSPWSQKRFLTLVLLAKERGLINGMEAYRLQRMDVARVRLRFRAGRPRNRSLSAMLEFCVRLLEQRW